MSVVGVRRHGAIHAKVSRDGGYEGAVRAYAVAREDQCYSRESTRRATRRANGDSLRSHGYGCAIHALSHLRSKRWAVRSTSSRVVGPFGVYTGVFHYLYDFLDGQGVYDSY